MPWIAGTTATWTSSAASLGNGNTLLTSTTVQNSGFIRIRLQLVVTFGSTPAAGTSVSCWVLRDDDGAGGNYEDGATGSPGLTPTRAPDVIFPTEASNGQQRLMAEVEWPYGYSKVLILNNSGQTMNAGWSIQGLPYDFK